jgi:glycosyltransferase involved in cell wall biosynthesis
VRKQRVIFILQNLDGGGAERTTLNTLRHLDRNRFEPVLFLLERSGVYFPEVPQDVRLVCACRSAGYNKYLTPYYLAKLVLEARRCDVIVGALELRPTYLAYAAAALLGKPVIGWVRVIIDQLLKQWRRWHTKAAQIIYPRLECVVCNSRGTAESIGKVAKIKPQRLRVINNFYETDSIINHSREAVPDWYTAVSGNPVVVAAGRMMPEKGFDILIKAHAKILKKGIDHNLVILGEGTLREELENLVCSLGLENSVFMPGYIRNPYPIIKKATAFVVSSRHEGFGGTIIEALLIGTPVVSTDCPGPREVLDNGRYGLIAPKEDSTALAEAIAELLTNQVLREKLSTSGVEHAKTFSAANTIGQWEQLLTEISK